MLVIGLAMSAAVLSGGRVMLVNRACFRECWLRTPGPGPARHDPPVR